MEAYPSIKAKIIAIVHKSYYFVALLPLNPWTYNETKYSTDEGNLLIKW